jgi:hypothetical protein
MKTKLLLLLVLTELTIVPLAFGQTDVTPTPVLSPSAQATPTQQMQGMDSSSDSMKQLAEMCQRMMRNEEAAMPYIIAASVLFGVLLFVALVLLIVLEIQWIKYWRRKLKSEK